MQALIDPTTAVQALTSWAPNPDPNSKWKYVAVYTPIENSARVCEVSEQGFPVAPPLFWTDCASDVLPDQWYYDTATAQTLQVPPPAPYPTQGTEGLQAV